MEEVTEPRRMGNNGNLTVPEKGEVRNPNGRPKGSRNRSSIIRDILEAAANKQLLEKAAAQGINPEEFGFKGDVQIVDVLTAAQVLKSIAGNTSAYQELMDSTYGKNVDNQSIMHSFSRMGTISIDDGGGAKDKPVKSVSLTFNIGDDAPEVSQDGNNSSS